VLAELELMQEKIRLIQAQLSSKSAGSTSSSKPAEQCSAVVGAVSASSRNNSPTVTSTDVKCNNSSLQGMSLLVI
jgi:Flp pilus assembly protein TadG